MLHQADKDRYWEAVELALDVLEAPRDLAFRFRERLESLHAGPQELFYHAEPLDVAKDLAGREACTEAQIDAYVRKVSEHIRE